MYTIRLPKWLVHLGLGLLIGLSTIGAAKVKSIVPSYHLPIGCTLRYSDGQREVVGRPVVVTIYRVGGDVLSKEVTFVGQPSGGYLQGAATIPKQTVPKVGQPLMDWLLGDGR